MWKYIEIYIYLVFVPNFWHDLLKPLHFLDRGSYKLLFSWHKTPKILQIS